MTTTRLSAALLALALTACSPTSQPVAEPPPGFPDISQFRSADPHEYDHTGTVSFYSPLQKVHCTLDWGPQKSLICHGLDGIPADVTGTGCGSVGKPDDDSGYRFSRSQGACGTAKSVRPMNAGRKLVGENGTCVVGKGELVACIDKDHRHGFVLQPSGSWAF